MENIIRWFKNENAQGYIEYKDESVFIYCASLNEQENKNEYIKFELVKIDDGYEMKPMALDGIMQQNV